MLIYALQSFLIYPIPLPIYQLICKNRNNFKDASVSACIASVSNKSFARRMESDIQMLFKQKGYSLESDTDSKHTLFSNSGLDGTR